MDEHKELIEALKDLKNEMVLHRTGKAGHGKPWYERSPFKEALAHGMTATLAIILVSIISTCTGKPIPVELAKDMPLAAPTAVPVAVPAVEATQEVVQAEGPLAPLPSATGVASAAPSAVAVQGAKAKRPKRVIPTGGELPGPLVAEQATALAYAPAPPPSSSSAAPPAMAAPTAASAR